MDAIFGKQFLFSATRAKLPVANVERKQNTFAQLSEMPTVFSLAFVVFLSNKLTSKASMSHWIEFYYKKKCQTSSGELVDRFALVIIVHFLTRRMPLTNLSRQMAIGDPNYT